MTTAPLSDYREFPPPPAVRPHILCFWSQSVSPANQPYLHRVLPDACADIAFINHDTPVLSISTHAQVFLPFPV